MLPKSKHWEKLKWRLCPINNILFRIDDAESPSCGFYLKTLINIFSALQCVPFYIYWDGGTCMGHSCMTCSYKLQKKCFMLRAISVCVLFGSVVAPCSGFYDSIVLLQEEKANASMVIEVISYVADSLTMILAWKFIWIRPEELVDVINSLSAYQHPQRHWKSIACGVVFTMVVLGFGAGAASQRQRSVIDRMTSASISIIEHAINWSTNYTLNISECRTLRYFITCWGFLSQRMAGLGEYLVSITAFSVKVIGTEFSIIVTYTDYVDEISHHHGKLKSLRDKLNNSTGMSFLMFYVSTLTYYSGLPAQLKRAGSSYKFWYKSVYLVLHGSTWIWSSEFYSQVQLSLRKWIHERKLSKKITEMEIGKLNLLALEVEHDPIGISCPFFIVSYSQLASLIGLFITYVVLSFQSLPGE